jgi:hypothetical protein
MADIGGMAHTNSKRNRRLVPLSVSAVHCAVSSLKQTGHRGGANKGNKQLNELRECKNKVMDATEK